MKKFVFLLCAGLASAAPALAAETSAPPVLSLYEAWRLAREHDAVISAAAAARDAGSEKLIQGRSKLLPTVALGANIATNNLDVQYTPDVPVFPSGIHRFRSNAAEVTLKQPLIDGANFALYQQGKSMAEQAQTRYASAEQELILRVAQAYFDVMLARDNVAFLESQAAAVQTDMARAKREFEVGRASVVDEREAQAHADTIQARLIAGRGDLEIKTQVLAKLIGNVPGALVTPREPVKLAPPTPQDPKAWEDAAEHSSLDVAQSAQALKIAKEEVNRQNGARLPSVDLFAAYSTSNQDDSAFGVGIDSTTKVVGVSLQMPLFAGGALSSRVREAQDNLLKAQDEHTETVRQARLGANAAYVQTRSLQAQEAALEQAVASSESLLAATRRGFEVGRRSNLDVLNAEQALYGARRDLAAARYAFFLSRLRLAAIAGHLTEEELREVDGHFN